ncbi:MAG: VOC family protein [Acidaminococcaceae bacterium]|nr:VOC family protein [Acidaminococcaceae bacterium]MBQ9698315.1 VOC family protein [Acidaminococcaceae bacterium]MBR1591211.1 VOC family protein [Acidaminococcaceae bacterium]
MMIKFAHNNFNVLDLEKSLKFYKEALNLTEVRRLETPDFTLVYLGDNGVTPHLLELTWLKDRKEPYNLGENEFHLAFVTDDFDSLHEKHKKMGCICYENPMMGIYFITDPDNYWLEILPER